MITSTDIHGVSPTKFVKKEATSQGWKKIYGMQFPTGGSLEKGFFPKKSSKELIRNNIQQLLLTEKGERVMLPNFGVSLRRFLFQPLDRQLFDVIQGEIVSAFSNYLPNVEIVKLSVVPLDSFGSEGMQALQIKLIVKLLDRSNIIVDVGVTLS